jgi:hypothetical protein
VDDAIRASRSTPQAVGIVELTPMYLGTRRDERPGGRIRASQAEHLMARADEFLNDRSSDEACSASDEDPHGLVLSLMCRPVAAPCPMRQCGGGEPSASAYSAD